MLLLIWDELVEQFPKEYLYFPTTLQPSLFAEVVNQTLSRQVVHTFKCHGYTQLLVTALVAALIFNINKDTVTHCAYMWCQVHSFQFLSIEDSKSRVQTSFVIAFTYLIWFIIHKICSSRQTNYNYFSSRFMYSIYLHRSHCARRGYILTLLYLCGLSGCWLKPICAHQSLGSCAISSSPHEQRSCRHTRPVPRFGGQSRVSHTPSAYFIIYFVFILSCAL